MLPPVLTQEASYCKFAGFPMNYGKVVGADIQASKICVPSLSQYLSSLNSLYLFFAPVSLSQAITKILHDIVVADPATGFANGIARGIY